MCYLFAVAFLHYTYIHPDQLLFLVLAVVVVVVLVSASTYAVASTNTDCIGIAIKQQLEQHCSVQLIG